MNPKYRKTVIAGNWKMNMLNSQVKPFAEELKGIVNKPKWCEDVYKRQALKWVRRCPLETQVPQHLPIL